MASSAAGHTHHKSHKGQQKKPGTAIAKREPEKLDEKKERPVWLSILKWVGIAIVVRELYITFGPRRQNKRDVFNLALQRSNATGKPLLVIGDPDSGFVNRFIGRDYDCGSLCIDQAGCLSCPHHESGPLEDLLPKMASNAYVVFVNSRLERVVDIDKTLSELARVSGSDIYAVTNEPYTLTSMFWSFPRRQFFEAPPRDARFRWKPLPFRASKSTATVYELPHAPTAKR
jgi:hypothetical protein